MVLLNLKMILKLILILKATNNSAHLENLIQVSVDRKVLTLTSLKRKTLLLLVDLLLKAKDHVCIVLNISRIYKKRKNY